MLSTIAGHRIGVGVLVISAGLLFGTGAIVALSRSTPTLSASIGTSDEQAPEVISNANFVNDLAYDARRRVVWAATSGGVVRWSQDGQTYQKFTTLDGLPSNVVMSVAVNPITGDVWFGTFFGGAVRLDAQGNWTKPTEIPGLSLVVDITIEEATGDVWFASGTSLYWLTARGRWYTFETGDDVHDVALDTRTGDVWAATSAGAVKLSRQGDLRNLTTADGLPHAIVLSVMADSAGRVWFGTIDGLAVRDASGNVQTISHIMGKKVGVVQTVVTLANEIWVGCKAGLFVMNAAGEWRDVGSRFTDATVTVVTSVSEGIVWIGMQRDGGIAFDEGFGQWRALRTNDILPIGEAGWLEFDTTGNLLAGTSGYVFGPNFVFWYGTAQGMGLFRRRPDATWEQLSGGNWHCDLPIRPVRDKQRHGYWFGTECAGVRFLADDDVITTYTRGDGLVGDSIQAVAVNQQSGDVWLGSDGNGVSRLQADGTWRSYTTSDGLIDDHVTVATVDDSGDVWFGSPTGASRLSSGGRWVRYSAATELSGNEVTSIVTDSASGDVWLATDWGASRISKAGRVTNFTKQEGLPAGGIRDIVVDELRNRVWLLSRENGDGTGGQLFSIAGDDRVDTVHPAPSKTYVHAIKLDSVTDTLWLATSSGIYRLDGDTQWVSVLEGSGYSDVVIDPHTGDAWLTMYGGIIQIPKTFKAPSAHLYLPLLRLDVANRPTPHTAPTASPTPPSPTATSPTPTASPTARKVIGADNVSGLYAVSTFEEEDFLETVAFDASGAIAAWGGSFGARVMDLTQQQPGRLINAHAGTVQSVAFGALTSWLYTSGVDADGGRVRVWDRVADREVQSFVCAADGWGAYVAVSPDERLMMCGGNFQFRLLRRAEVTWEPLSESLFGTYFLFLGDDRIAYWSVGWHIADMPDGLPGRIVPFLPEPTGLAAVSRDNQLFAISTGTEIGIWRLADGVRQAHMTAHRVKVSSGVFSPSGQILVSGDDNGVVRVWRVSDGELLWTITKHTAKVDAVSFSPGGTRMATVDAGGKVIFWAAR